MADKLCLATIMARYPQLTGKEKQLADYVLRHAPEVVHMSVTELAEAAGVVKSAVVRCCKSLDFSGYSEFKIQLAAEMAKNKNLQYVPYISAEDTTGVVLDKVFSANIKTLHDTVEHIHRPTIEAIVEQLFVSHSIYIYGVGTSSGIVNDFQYRLMQLGYNAFCFTDGPSMKVSTLNIREGDFAVGISHSGRTIATIETLRLARAAGAKTACVTSCEGSSITKVSDYPVVIYTDEIQYPAEAISARIAHISVLDAISISLSAKKFDEATERAAKTREIIDTDRCKL